MSEPMLKGACVKCGEHVAFPESHAGNKVPCPHCSALTPLIPGRQTEEGLFYKCSCGACGARIEYHARLIGNEVVCPHCQQKTTLTAPAIPVVALAPASSILQKTPVVPMAAVTPAPPRPAAAPAPASSILQKTPVEPMAAVSAAAPPAPVARAVPPTPAASPAKPPPPAAKPVMPAAKPVMPGGKTAVSAAAGSIKTATTDKPVTLVDPPPGPMANPPAPPTIPRAAAKAAQASSGRSLPKWLVPTLVGVGVLALVGVAVMFILPKFKSAGGQKAELEILKYELQKKADTGVVYVVGTVTNRSANQVFNVKVEFEILDGGGNVLEKTKDVKDAMPPKSDWRFSAIVTDKNYAEARPVGVVKD
ncbi:MAG: hypothetical protein HY300_20195 [Verrucomicrobia bacterium]|nr:hypothetical protein [Verrucomicrobiota bacterium]